MQNMREKPTNICNKIKRKKKNKQTIALEKQLKFWQDINFLKFSFSILFSIVKQIIKEVNF